MAVLDSLVKNRIITGFLMGTLVFLCIVSGGKWLLILLLLFIVFASKEYTDILRNKGFLPFSGIVSRQTAVYSKCSHYYFRIFDSLDALSYMSYKRIGS